MRDVVVAGCVGSGGAAEKQPGAGADRRTLTRLARYRTDRRARGCTDKRPCDGRTAPRWIRNELTGRRVEAQSRLRKLLTGEIVGLERFETLARPREHHHGRAAGHRDATGKHKRGINPT